MKIKKSELTKITKEVISELSPKDRKILKEKLLKEDSFNFSDEISQTDEILDTLRQNFNDVEVGSDVEKILQDCINNFDRGLALLKRAHRKRFN